MRARPTARLALLLVPLALVAAIAGENGVLLAAVLLLDVAAFVAVWLDARVIPVGAVTIDRVTPENVMRGQPFDVLYRVENKLSRRARVRLADPWSGIDERIALAPRAHVEKRMSVTLPARGVVKIAAPVGWLRSSIGLAERSASVETALGISVLPDVTSVGRFERLRRMRNLRALGITPTRQRGEGSEFDSLRPYALGDSYRAINWKATARRMRPVVRELRAEREQTLILLIDCGRRMAREVDGRSRLDRAVEAALLLAQVALRAGDRVGLVAFADQVVKLVPPGQGIAYGRRLAEAVAPLEAVLREPPYASIVAGLIKRFPRRSFFTLFTDAAEPESVDALIGPVGVLARRHLVASIVFRDEVLDSLRDATIDDARALYRAGAAADLAVERERALRSLKRGGVLVVESSADALSSAVVNRYLEAKARHLL